MAVLPKPAFTINPGESPGAFIERIVRAYAGANAHNAQREALAALVGRGVDDERIVDVTTNCALFALGVFAAAGVQHKLLTSPYVLGTAVTDVLTVARDLGALRSIAEDGDPKPGSACHFAKPMTNDDHIEFALARAHGGGGRPLNAIVVTEVPLAWPDAYGRTVLHWIDPDALGISTVPGAEVVEQPDIPVDVGLEVEGDIVSGDGPPEAA